MGRGLENASEVGRGPESASEVGRGPESTGEVGRGPESISECYNTARGLQLRLFFLSYVSPFLPVSPVVPTHDPRG